MMMIDGSKRQSRTTASISAFQCLLLRLARVSVLLSPSLVTFILLSFLVLSAVSGVAFALIIHHDPATTNMFSAQLECLTSSRSWFYCRYANCRHSSTYMSIRRTRTQEHDESNKRSTSYAKEDYETYSRFLFPLRKEDEEQQERDVLHEVQEFSIVDQMKKPNRPYWSLLRTLNSSSIARLFLEKIAKQFPSLRSAESNPTLHRHHQNIDLQRRKHTKKWWKWHFRTKPGVLILMVAGESTWRQNRTFTGWADPDLTPTGIRMVQHAARLLLAEGYEPDVVYTSRLRRAIRSVRVMLQEWDSMYLPVFKSYRLNERMYGAAQGLSKDSTADQLGGSIVQAWRNSLKARPPPLSRVEPSHPCHDRRYSDLNPNVIPDTESLLDCYERARPLWQYRIRRDLQQGYNVLVVAHKGSLSGLVKAIDGLSDTEIVTVTLPSSMPLVYRFDNDMSPIQYTSTQPNTLNPHPNSFGCYLEKPGLLEKALERQHDWRRYFDYDHHGIDKVVLGRVSTLEQSLLQLRAEQLQYQNDFRGKNEHSNHPQYVAGGDISVVEPWDDDPSEFELFDELDPFNDIDDNISTNNEMEYNDIINKQQLVSETKPQGTEQPNSDSFTVNHPNDPVVVLVRHGRTPHNNLGLFTGWQDPPLAEEGIEDAKRAGRLLKNNGYEFDVVYTSCLTRAIQTATYIMDEMDCIWLPIVKSWRLNERNYGSLTGKSKTMIQNEYGIDQLMKWRKGYTNRPPPISSYSPDYAGNDSRRIKHVRDLPISISETLARSWEQRQLVLHRKFPKTESLHDCMKRSIPYYTNRIGTEAIAKGKRVLIASHENALRGILMHLCNIPESAMNQLHIPNGLPLVYHVNTRCITILADDDDNDDDDASNRSGYDIHDFGPAAQYLFRSCNLVEVAKITTFSGGP